LYDVMRKEVRQAVEEIRTQLEKTVTKSEPSEKVLSSDAQPTQVLLSSEGAILINWKSQKSGSRNC